MKFRLNGREGGALVEVLVNFKYLGQPLDQTEDDCSAVGQIINQARKVWRKLGGLLRR